MPKLRSKQIREDLACMAPGALQTEASKHEEAGFSTESAPWQRAAFEGDNTLKRKLIAAAAATFAVLLLVVSCTWLLKPNEFCARLS